MQKQQKNKNLKNHSLEENRNQQDGLKLENRRQKQKKQLERKLLQEEEQKLNNIPSPTTIDIPATLTQFVIAPNATDDQPLIQSRQVNIAEVDETENIENGASVKTLRVEIDTEIRAESKKMNKRCKANIDKLLQTPTQFTQITHELHVDEATEKTLKDLTEIQDLCGNNDLSERLEMRAESEKEHSQETSSISICAKKKHKKHKKIKNQKALQELEQQLMRQELRRQRKEIQLNKEMLHRQEKQKRREKQQELEEQQRLKKEEKRQQLERKRHDIQSQKHNATPATNDIVDVSTESVKESIPYHSLQDNMAKVDVTKKQMFAEEDKVLQADSQKPNEALIVKVGNLLQAPIRITRAAHELPVVEVTHTKDLTALPDSVRDTKHLESSEKSASKNFENETFCEKHELTIRSLREEIDNMREKLMNIRTDIDLNVIVNEVRTECEINGREAIEKLKVEHEAEVKNLQMYYNSNINEIHLNHGTMMNDLQRNHEGLVYNLRNLNYSQGVRQEAALQSMRELKEKTRKEHQQEIQQIREKYDNTIKRLIEEKELLCNKHKKVVQNLRDINQDLRLKIVATMRGLRAEHETAIKVLRREYDSLVEMPIPNLIKQIGIVSTEVEGLQRKLVEEEQQHTIITDGAFSCSLRSHKHGSSHPCLPSTSDSTSKTHLTPISNTISPPFDPSSSPSSSSSSHAISSAISSTPTLSPDTSSPGSIPFILPTPSVPTDNTDIFNSIIQLLSSPAFSALKVGKTSTPDKSTLASPPTSNASQSSAVSVSNPHPTSLLCAPGSTSSASSILPTGLPCGGSVSSILNTVQIPKLPYSPSTPASGANGDLSNFLVKISSLVPSPPYLSTSKPTPLSPPCPLFTPTSNKNVLPGKKPCSISHPAGPLLSGLPDALRGSPSSSNRPVPLPVPEKFSTLTPAPVLEHGPEIAPEEFPAPSNVPVSIPVETSTSTLTSSYSYNPDFVNFLHKLLVASQAKFEFSSSPLPTKTHVTTTLNPTPVSAPSIKPPTISPACGILSESSSSCSSSIIHNHSNSSISRLQQILMSMTPLPASGISFGYNPEFMKLLIKNLLSNHTSSLPPLPSLNSIIQAKLNTTPIVPLDSNPIPTSTTNRPLPELNPNVFNTSSNNTFDSGSDTNQNTSISNDQFLTNILIKLLTSSNSSNTSLLPCLPSTNSNSISTLNTSVPCIPPFISLPDILSKIPNLKPGSNPPFPGLIPSPIVTSLPNIKPFSEKVKNLNLLPTLTPTSYPLSSSSDTNLCRLKHKKPLQLPSSTSTAVDPCLKNILRPNTPHLPLPCSLSHTKLSSGCKH
ncbi:hypothetical protein ACI65C_003953 [Semiaphis heraclei]